VVGVPARHDGAGVTLSVVFLILTHSERAFDTRRSGCLAEAEASYVAGFPVPLPLPPGPPVRLD
jgi:hypothetical protein